MSRFPTDTLTVWTLRAIAALAGTIVVLILLFIVQEALPALRGTSPLRFFTDPSWHPIEGLYDMVPMLTGTVLITIGAVAVAAPMGILSAIFCNFYAPRAVARWYGRMIELLAGIPSVVYGLWGLVVLVPLIACIRLPGACLLAGIVILSLMILPTVALMARASLASVPREYLMGAEALGLTRWAKVRRVVLPAAKSGLFTGVLLATARALGETMAVLMVTGNVARVPGSLFDPIRTLTANMALEMSYAMPDHRSALFVSALLLMIAVVALIAVAEIISKGRIHVR